MPLDVVNLVSHATQSRLRSLLEKVSAVAQHRTDRGKVSNARRVCVWLLATGTERSKGESSPPPPPQDEERHEQMSDVRSQLRFFEQLELMEKQRKDEQEREILLKAAKVQLSSGGFSFASPFSFVPGRSLIRSGCGGPAWFRRD